MKQRTNKSLSVLLSRNQVNLFPADNAAMQINIDILVLVVIICCEHNKVETVPKDITSITDNWPTCWGCLAITIAEITYSPAHAATQSPNQTPNVPSQ